MNDEKSQNSKTKGHLKNSSYHKRNRESPESHQSSPKKLCDTESPPKTSSMSQMEDIVKLIQASFNKAEKKQEELRMEMNASFKVITEGMQKQLDSLTARMSTIEATQSTSSDVIATLKNQIDTLQCQADYNTNKMEQQKRECDIIARGLPSIYANNLDGLVNVLNEKFNSSLSPNNVAIEAYKPRPEKHTCTYFFKFKAKHHKSDFMKAVKNFRKNDLITLEDIFDNFKGTNHAGFTIFFNNSLTKVNKELLDAAAKEKKAGKLAYVWEKDGRILMRKQEGDYPVEAITINQIHEFASQ
jgi:hypothetical protein